MRRKHKKAKPKTFLVGRLVFIAVSIAVGAFGVLGWMLGPGDLWQRLPLATLAGAAAFVVPICAGQLGRHKLSVVFILPAALFMGWTAYSTEHANETLIEAPRKAAHEKAQAAPLAEVAAAKARVVALQAKRDAIEPEVITCQPCLNTRAQADKRYTDKLDRADREIRIAEGVVDKKQLMVAPYHSVVESVYVLVFGALLDLVLAAGIFGLEHSARHEARKLEAEKARSKKAAARHVKRAKPVKTIPDGTVTAAEELELLRLRGAHLRVVR